MMVSVRTVLVPWGLFILGGAVMVFGGILLFRHFLKRKKKAEPTQHDSLLDFWDGTERRTSPREPGNALTVTIADPLTGKELGQGKILDRSLGGLGLETPLELPVGTRVYIRLVGAEGKEPWILGEVRYCRFKEDLYRVGCQFVDVSSWDVMNLFGPPDPE